MASLSKKDMCNKIGVLLAEDHPLIREALRNAANKQTDIEVIAEACNGEQAIKLAMELEPHVIIMDISMPGIDGLEATRQIKSKNPSISILTLTVHEDEEFLLGMLEAGADGYLIKSVSSNEIMSAIRALVAGEMVVPPDILRKIIKHSYQMSRIKPPKPSTDDILSSRELEILRLVAQCKTNKEIAQKLGLSLQTIKSYLLTIFAKLNARSRTEAVLIGLHRGILNMASYSDK